MSTQRRRPGFSIFELLMVVTIMGILAAIAIPNLTPGAAQQLRSAGKLLAADLTYARSLAVANNSYYLVTFDLQDNCYVLTHSGTNASLDTLPDSAMRNPSDPDDQQIVDLKELPDLAGKVCLYAVRAGGAVTTVEFGPLGSTERSAETTIWLQIGNQTEPRWIGVTINPVTGLATVGDVLDSPPSM